MNFKLIIIAAAVAFILSSCGEDVESRAELLNSISEQVSDMQVGDVWKNPNRKYVRIRSSKASLTLYTYKESDNGWDRWTHFITVEGGFITAIYVHDKRNQ